MAFIIHFLCSLSLIFYMFLFRRKEKRLPEGSLLIYRDISIFIIYISLLFYYSDWEPAGISKKKNTYNEDIIVGILTKVTLQIHLALNL